jgi:hypothetical protein
LHGAKTAKVGVRDALHGALTAYTKTLMGLGWIQILEPERKNGTQPNTVGGRKMTYWIRRNLGIVSEDEPKEPGIVILDVRDLRDEANPPQNIIPKIAAGVWLVEHGMAVVVQCQGGISRSPGIAAAIIAYMDKIPFEDALNEVQDKVRRAMPEMSLRDSIKSALRTMNEQHLERKG